MPTKKKSIPTMRTTPVPAPMCLSPSREVLIQACEALDERDETRGAPEETLDRIAAMWTAYLRDHSMHIDTDLDGKDAALMMALLKIARAQVGRHDIDNYVDGAGYLALAAEMDETL
jgi:hypothetical protein